MRVRAAAFALFPLFHVQVRARAHASTNLLFVWVPGCMWAAGRPPEAPGMTGMRSRYALPSLSTQQHPHIFVGKSNPESACVCAPGGERCMEGTQPFFSRCFFAFPLSPSMPLNSLYLQIKHQHSLGKTSFQEFRRLLELFVASWLRSRVESCIYRWRREAVQKIKKQRRLLLCAGALWWYDAPIPSYQGRCWAEELWVITIWINTETNKTKQKRK